MFNVFKVRSVGIFKCMIVGVQTWFISDVVCKVIAIITIYPWPSSTSITVTAFPARNCCFLHVIVFWMVGYCTSKIALFSLAVSLSAEVICLFIASSSPVRLK